MLTVRVLGEPFGAAEIDNLVVDDADPDAAAQVRDLLWRHGVVCIRQRGQLDDATMRALVAMIGEVKEPIGRTRDGASVRYGDSQQIVDAGFVLTDELRAELGDLNFGGLDPDRPGLFETFHTDDSFVEQPALVTVLHARELPSRGGDTVFLDMRAAFDMLTPDRREAALGRSAAHAYNNHGAFPPRVASEGPFEALVDVAHPIVRAHPQTGRPALYFDLDRATHVVDMPEDEGRALLQSLQDHAEQTAPRYAHRWQPNDVVMWDNSAVQHKASGDFPVGEPRRFWRYMVAGPVPLAYEG